MNVNLSDMPFWLHNGNAETIFAKLLQSAPPAYRHELLSGSTGKTQIVYGFVDAARPDVPLAVLFHGLEGGSMSHYAVGTMEVVQRRGWHGVVAHFRSCGGITNTASVFYHPDGTREIDFMLETLAARYPRIYAADALFGGNVLVKYLGEEGTAAAPRTAAAMSVSADLTAVGVRFDRNITRPLYTCYLLHLLVPKTEAFPHFQTASPSKNCKTLGGFNDLFTALLHGFTNWHDYYRRASCKSLLHSVRTPLLLLNATSDLFLLPEVLPTATGVSDTITLLQSSYGGHVGFANKSSDRLNIEWAPETVLHYFETHGREAVWKAVAFTSPRRRCRIGCPKNSQIESQP